MVMYPVRVTVLWNKMCIIWSFNNGEGVDNGLLWFGFKFLKAIKMSC